MRYMAPTDSTSNGKIDMTWYYMCKNNGQENVTVHVYSDTVQVIFTDAAVY